MTNTLRRPQDAAGATHTTGAPRAVRTAKARRATGRHALAAAVAGALLLLTGCGGGSHPTEHLPTQSRGKSSSTASSSAQSGTLNVTIRGGKTTPTGAAVEATTDAPLIVRVTADAPGELHVHSSPEQHVEFGKGTTVKRLTFARPGVVEIEDHETGTVIAQVEVR